MVENIFNELCPEHSVLCRIVLHVEGLPSADLAT